MEPMKLCPKYQLCSAPLCPLDPEMNKRISYPDDPKCKMEKGVRMKLGRQLKNKGLFPAELAQTIRWENRSEEDKEKIRARGRANLAKIRGV